MAPDYISQLFTKYITACRLHSQAQNLLVVPRARLKSNGDRAEQSIITTTFS